MPDLTGSFQKLLDQGLLGVIVIFLGIAVVSLYKKVMELQDKRLGDSKETNSTVSIALHAVTDSVENMGNTMKSILISLERKNDKE